jgi:DNA polymerase-3 subunit gamma/tau
LAESRATTGGDRAESIDLEVASLYVDSLKDAKTQGRLTEAARAFFGLVLSWRIHSRQETRAELEQGAKSRSSRTRAHHAVMEHPAVQQALEILGGELIDIRRIKPTTKKRRDGREDRTTAIDEPRNPG